MNVKIDDCFQFGLGAFETISVVDGRPIFLLTFGSHPLLV